MAALHPDEIHVWHASLEMPDAALAPAQATLDQHELARAERLRSPHDRRRFVAAHGALRAILAGYLGGQPNALRFQNGPRGKPHLLDEPSLRFNLSHSGECALVAVAWEREVGIDIEQIRPERAGMAIAERFFSPYEAAILRGLPDGERIAAFFRCWTRKESYIKARGDGFGLPLDAFDVALAPGEPPALLRTRHDPDDAARWTLRDVPVGDDYGAALAVQGSGWRLILRRWRTSP